MARRRGKSLSDIANQRSRIFEELERRGVQYTDGSRYDKVDAAFRKYNAKASSYVQDKWDKMSEKERSKYNSMVKYGSTSAKANFSYSAKVPRSVYMGLSNG